MRMMNDENPMRMMSGYRIATDGCPAGNEGALNLEGTIPNPDTYDVPSCTNPFPSLCLRELEP